MTALTDQMVQMKRKAQKGQDDMNGKGNVRFSELFADAIAVHGVVWAANHYRKQGMKNWEFNFWLDVICKVHAEGGVSRLTGY